MFKLEERFFYNLIINFHHIINVLVGFAPYHNINKNKKFYFSKYLFLYSIIIVILFISIYLKKLIELVAGGNSIIIIIKIYIGITSIIIKYFMQWKNAKKIITKFNELQKIQVKLLKFTVNDSNIESNNKLKEIFINFFEMLIIIIVGVYGLINIFRFVLTFYHKNDNLFLIIVTFFYFVQMIIPYSFYCVIQTIYFSVKLINIKINNLLNVTSIEYLYIKSDYIKMKKFCELSEILDEFLTIYDELLSVTTAINQLFSIQLLINVLNLYAVIILEVIAIIYDKISNL